MGSNHPTIAPYSAFPTAGGYVLAVPSPNNRPDLSRAIYREVLLRERELSEDEIERLVADGGIEST